MEQETVDTLEKLIGKLDGAYKELSILSKKSPNDGVNKFKLNIINKIIAECNEFLGDEDVPVEDFDKFDIDDLPSNSDVIFILTQYAEALEKCRSDLITNIYGNWYYILSDKTEIPTAPPIKIKGN